MTSRKMSFFEFWSRKKERGALLKRANQLRLLPSQLTQLLGDSGVRAELQNGRLVSLLPPVGTEVFRHFSPASLGEIQQRHEAEEKEPKKKKKNKERAKKDLPKPSSDLEAGKPLPFIYGDPPPELLNTPLEELDPYYQSQKTFIVLSKGNVIHRFNAEPACNLLSPFNLLRTVAIKILIHSLFRWFIMVTILTNCMLMTLSTPPAWTKTVEYVFTAIYTFEALIKVVSRGFCVTNFTFLRDPWNWLDVMVVSMAYVAQFVGLWKFSVLSTVPRVLKLITVIPGLRTTVVAFVQSVKRLAHVAVLTVFWLSIFSMIALQIFMGSLRQKCIIMPWHRNLTSDFTLADYYFNETGNPDFEFDSYISSPVNQYHLPGHLNALLCGNRSDAGVCSDGYTCIKGGRNPNYGFTNYDSFGWSFLSVFRLMTEDYCEDLIEMTLRAAGKVNMIFFIAIAPGCFFLLSLLLAVVVMTFSEQEEDSVAEAKQKEEEFRQILEALKKREEEEAACRAAPSEIQNGENKKSPEHIPMEEFEKDQRSCSPCWSVFAGLFLKWNCCGCWRWLKQRLYAFISNPFFDLGIVVCLVLHTLYISMEHFPMSMWFEWHLTVADMVFTAIFTAEMIIKIVALDPYGYFQVGWNVFDCIIVTFSLLDLCLADFNLFFKLMRVIRLARWWPSFHMFLKLIWTSVRALRNVTLLPLITVFIFTVVGVQLFGTDYKECVCRISADCELPRWHMNDFFHSFLLIFRILCGEWIETLWDCMEVAGQTTCLIFFMMVVVIGNLLVLNLFLTLLLSSFSDDSLEAKNMEKNNLQIAISRIKTWTVEHICRRKKKHHVNPDNTGGKEYLALNLTSDQSLSEVKDLSGNLGNLADKHRNIESGRAPLADIEIELKTPENEEEKKFDDVEKHPEVQKNENDEDHRQNTPEDCCSARCYSCCPFLDIDTSQGAGRVWSNFRRACFTITQHINFEAFMIVIILLSSSALVYEDIHLQQREILRAVVERADQVFTFLFLLEMLLKWIAFGLKKYFTSGWCWFDFLILSVSLVSLTADMFGFLALGAFQSLRTLRALMPLRIVSRFQGLRVVVLTLLRTVQYMFDGLLVLLTVWLMFSILGVNMFAGKFYYCLNHTTWEMFPRDEVNNMSDCLSLNHPDVIWVRRELDFDSVSRGYLSLLHLASSNEWLDVMYSAMDSTEVEGQPDFEANMSMSLYFICFIIIGCFFSFIFFIRGIINKLQTDKFGGKHIFMTERQQKYSKVLKKLFFKKPQKLVPRPQNRCQAGLFDLVTKPCFEVFMVVVICLNLVTLMLETDSMSHQTDVILYWIHMVFILIFLTEFIVKIIALRKYYFKDCLNVLDFVVIIFSIGGLFITDLLEKYFVSPFFFPMLRVARISRVLHLSRFTRGIKRSLPAIFNIGILLVLLMVTFSIFGMFNFAYVKRVFMINDMYNFETFWNSMICLFTITTSPAWSGVVSSIMSTPPNCDPDLENPGSTVRGDCGSPAAAIFFLVSYIALPFLLVIYLYIAVVLGTFNSEDTEPLSDDDLRMFSKTWRQFDPDASQLIQYSKLSDFCDTLQDPLRIPKPNTIKLIHMDLPLLPGDTIHCSDVFLALAAQVLDDSEAMDTLKTRMEEKFMAYSSKVSSEPISSTLRRKQEEQAALVIQRAYRKCLLQQRDAEESAAQPLNGVGDVSSVAGTSLPPTLN